MRSFPTTMLRLYTMEEVADLLDHLNQLDSRADTFARHLSLLSGSIGQVAGRSLIYCQFLSGWLVQNFSKDPLVFSESSSYLSKRECPTHKLAVTV